ncbi:hypothetical protein LCGC14_1828380 [marine sediment metagenome]|uniref:Core-binding (CB) domain-containing protein n=1 Tax=marine sediment metagenome TaxID=412755 RepID=A0A0F9GGS9_9ZZZZ
MISPALRDALEGWLAGLSALSGSAANTQTAYRGDVVGFLSFVQTHLGDQVGMAALRGLSIRDMRAWMAHERARGVGARSLARELSAVKSFIRWLAEREGFDPTAVLMTRSPKFEKKLPRPLEVSAARAMIETVELQSLKGWVGARDVAVVTVLYGCGLRISEALGLTGARLSRLELLRALLLSGLTFVAALPVGLLLAWVLLAVINVEAFGWRLPMHVFPADWAILGALALLAGALASLWPAWRIARMPPSALLGIFANER